MVGSAGEARGFLQATQRFCPCAQGCRASASFSGVPLRTQFSNRGQVTQQSRHRAEDGEEKGRGAGETLPSLHLSSRLSQLQRLLALCYWKTEESRTKGCSWGGGVPSLWGLAHPPHQLSCTGTGTKPWLAWMHFLSPGESPALLAKVGLRRSRPPGYPAQEPWKCVSETGSWGGKWEGTSPQSGRDRVRKPVSGEICGRAVEKTLLCFGMQQYFCWALDNMGWSIQGRLEGAGSRQASVWDWPMHIRKACMEGSQSTAGLKKK